MSKSLPSSHSRNSFEPRNSSRFKNSFELASFFPLDRYAFLQASGKDARSFLHSITTCDLNSIGKGSIVPSAILNRKGHVLFLFYIFCVGENDYYLFTNDEEVGALEKCLDSFLFSERVVLTVYQGRTSVIFANELFHNFLGECPTLQPPEKISTDKSSTELSFSTSPSANIFSSPSSLTHTLTHLKNFSFSADLSECPLMVFRIDAVGEPCLFFFSPSLEKIEPSLKTKILEKYKQVDQFLDFWKDWHQKQSADLLKKEKVPCDFASMCFDAGFFLDRRCFPLGALFNHLEKERCFIAMTKGCYPGQEIVERIKTQNKLATHRLCALLFSQKDYEHFKNNVSPKEKLFFEEQLIGEVVAFAFSCFYQCFVVTAYLTRKRIKSKEKFYPVVNGVAYGQAEIKSLPFYVQTDAERYLKKQYEAAMRLFHDGKYIEMQKMLLPIVGDREMVGDRGLVSDKAMSCEKTYPEILEMLAVVAEKLNDRKSAIEYNRLFSYYDPNAVMPHTNLSRLLMLDGLIESAEKEKGIATMKQFRKGDARNEEEDAAAKKAASEAKKKMFLNILAQNDSEEIALFSLGKIFFEEKNYEAAKQKLEKLTTIDPMHSLGWAFLSKSLLALKQEALAKKSLEKGMAVAKEQGEMMPLKLMQEDYAKIS